MSDHPGRSPRRPQIGSQGFGSSRGLGYRGQIGSNALDEGLPRAAADRESGSDGMIDLFSEVSGYPGAGHYVLVRNGGLEAFYSLGMSEVELRSQHRKKLSGSHPRQGAVLILWLARAAETDCGAEAILKHAVGMSQIGARQIGAAAIALDPFDAGTEQFWRERFGFRASLTRRRDADGKERPRLWMPLFPSG